jgi:acyl carrier protein
VIYAPGLPVSESIGGVTDKPELMYQRHFQTKGRGLRALDAALRDMPVAHCLIVGSLASVLGGIGSAGYTAANCYLDAYVERRNRTTSSPWRNVLWDHWIDPGAPGFREDTGCTREDSRAVLDAIARLTVPGPLAVSVQELNTRADSARIAERAKSPKRRSEDVVPLGDTRPPDLSTAYVAPRDELETYLASVWSDLLGIGDIGILDGFFELGGESLALMQMLTRLRAEYNIELPLDELYKDTTITALADLLRGGGTQAAAPPVAVDDDPLELYDDPDELARLLSEIEILSETEVQSELSRPTDQPH